MFCFQFSVTFRFYKIYVIIVPVHIIYVGTNRGVTLNFIFLNKEKSSCCLETKNISDETLKIVSRNYLNGQTNKEQIKRTSKRSLNVPYLRKVQFIIEMYIRSVQASKNCVNKRVVMKIMCSCKMKKNNFEVICLNVACYKEYVDYFKTTFPYTAPPT